MDRPESPYLRFLLEASVHLDGARDADKALRGALRIAREAFEADEVCLAVPRYGERRPPIYASQPTGVDWSREPFADFLAGRRPRLGATRLFAAVERRGRTWGVLALRKREGRFERSDLRDVARVGTAISRAVQRIDRARLAEVRARIDRKMMEQLRPLDLFYQVLHGLRSLTHYDHSGAVLIQAEDGGTFEVVAEQISWRKGPSARIGERLVVDEAATRLLQRAEVLGLDRSRGGWREWGDRDGAPSLATLVDEPEQEARPMSLLVAPFATRHEHSGCLVVASCAPGALGRYEAELVQRFLPVAVVAIGNLERATTLEAGVLAAESRGALATLARGVSHDVNNAIGAILPRVQQMEEDLREGEVEREVLLADVADIRSSIEVCRRIFGGLLSYARNASSRYGVGDLGRAVEGMRAVLSESLQRRDIELCVELPADLPDLRCSQNDLDQLVLNLASNARDAMPGGGQLVIQVEPREEELRLRLRDTGCGIPAEHLPRVKEPFFTTKPGGNGLGLSICRAILWRMRGEIDLESTPGEGTVVELSLPVAAEAGSEEAS